MPARQHALLALAAIAALAAVLSFTGAPETTPATARSATTATAELGTVSPAYPAGTYLEPGVEVLERIPVSDLSTTGLAKPDPADPCAGVPPDVVIPAEVFATPAHRDGSGCRWTGGHALTISTDPARSMPKHVELLTRAADHHAAGGDRLAHLAWLRVDGHYATESVAAGDRLGACHLTVDTGTPRVVHVRLHSLDFFSRTPIDTDPATAVTDHCPAARKVARNLVRHLDSLAPR